MLFKNLSFRLMFGVLILAPFFVVGCNDSVTVTGKVTYSDNGEPVKSGLVVFTGEKEAGRGVIKDGKYSIGLIKDGDGLPPGKYVVSADSLENPVYESVNMDGTRSTPTPQNQEIYYTKEPQTVDVSKAMTYDFAVERGKRQ